PSQKDELNNMPYTLVSDTEADDQAVKAVAKRNQADLKAVAKRKRLGESPIRDDKLLPKKQCLPDNLSLLPAELKSQIFLEVSDRKTLLNLSQVSKVFRAVFDRGKSEFFFSAYAKEFRSGELMYEDAVGAIVKHIKDPKAALILFEATWNGTLYGGSVIKNWFFMHYLSNELGAQEYDTLLLSLHAMYNHVALETSWAAWAGAIMALECLEDGSDKVAISGIRMEPWILDQFALRQREMIDQGVLEGQEYNARCVLGALRRYHEIRRHREEKRHLEWNHLERKKKHIDNLAEVLQAIVHLPGQERLGDYNLVAEWMLLEDDGHLGRHADFHSGVQCICHPSRCRHTADADRTFSALEAICINLISEGYEVDAREAISGSKYVR
ncbi:hypothetical protein V501_01274, partial [Pseudogymnoascus sp. VKM F-4519 (FW-2642)]